MSLGRAAPLPAPPEGVVASPGRPRLRLPGSASRPPRPGHPTGPEAGNRTCITRRRRRPPPCTTPHHPTGRHACSMPVSAAIAADGGTPGMLNPDRRSFAHRPAVPRPGAVGNWLRDVRGALRIVHAPRHLHKVGRRSAAEPAPRQCCPALPKALFTVPREAAPLDPVPTPFCAPRGTGGRACPGEWRVVCRYGHELLWTDAAGRASCSRGSRKPLRRGCGPAGRRRAQRPHRLRHRTRAAFEGVPRYDPDIPEAAAFGIVTHGTARRGLPGRIGLRISVVETGKGRLPCRA